MSLLHLQIAGFSATLTHYQAIEPTKGTIALSGVCTCSAGRTAHAVSSHPIQGHRRHSSPTAHAAAVGSMVQPRCHECTWQYDTRTLVGHPTKEQRHLLQSSFCVSCRIRIVATRCAIPLLTSLPQLRNQACGRRDQVLTTKATITPMGNQCNQKKAKGNLAHVGSHAVQHPAYRPGQHRKLSAQCDGFHSSHT